MVQEQEKALKTYIKLARALRSISRKVERTAPLPKTMTISQFGVLEALHHKGPLHQCEIAEKVLSSNGNMTMIIDNLAKSGLVTREQDKNDRRGNIVSLTEDGKKIIAKEFERHAEAIYSALAVLEPQEQSELARLCKKLGMANELTEK